MRPRISEFSYGFALTRELIDRKWNGLELTAAPFLPSLIAEGQEGGGFDVSLQSVNALVFLQFKVSHFMTRGTAKGVASGHINVPYYRFDVHAPRSSDQHRLLLQLEAASESPPRIVRYVAPAFYTEGEFDSAFLTGTVADRSIFVAPSQIVLPDEREHSVGFLSPSDTPVVLSEPSRFDGPADYSLFDRTLMEAARRQPPIDLKSRQLELVREAVIGIVSDVEPETRPGSLFKDEVAVFVRRDQIPNAERFPRADPALLRRMRPLDAIGNIAWTHFACQTIAVGSAEPPPR